MAQHSGFFNALKIDEEYDRKYNAEDYSDNLAVIIGNGVLRSENDDLKCTANGMVVSVGIGRAWINGHYYNNDTVYQFSPTPVSTGGNRYDRVVLRLNNEVSGRSITLEYLQGETSLSPVKPAPVRTDAIYDLVLCDILVTANESQLVVTDTRADSSICGWVYSVRGDDSFFESLDASFMEWFQEKKDTLASVTLFKKYTQKITLNSETSAVSFNIPQYDADTCFLEVYVNGIFDNRHTVSGNVITFEGSLIGGTVVTVNCYKSIDGTDIMSVADEITELQNQVATIIGVNKFSYKCTGLNDNIALSEIAQAIYAGSYTVGSLSDAAEAFLERIGGNTYLGQLTTEAQIEIDVVGKPGITTPAAGSGTTASRYRWFNIGVAASGEKKIIFDFAKCEKITIQCAANTNNIIFYGTDLFINNANVYAYSNGSGCIISMITGSVNTGKITCNDCRFSVSTSGDAVIAENGNFTNCYGVVKSTAGNSSCFNAKSVSLVRVIGGTYLAYTSQASKYSTCFNVDSGETNAVITAYNINCPIIAQSGYSQYFTARTYAGMTYINGIISTNGYGGTASYRTVNGQIEQNKYQR